MTGSPLAATFVYDWEGQRFSKTDNGETPSIYSYAQGGTLIAENDGGITTDYIYADGRPIAILQPNATIAADQVNYVTADRLGTPQVVSNSGGTPVWSTTYQPFGSTGLINASISQNLRFPGQYADVETGFSYNLNRDYMPNLGRYLESDPIGIKGGMNSYGYVNGSPESYVDREGLDASLFIPSGMTPADIQGMALQQSYDQSTQSAEQQAGENIREQFAENLDTFGSATGIAGVGSLLIPGLEPAAPVLGAVSFCAKSTAYLIDPTRKRVGDITVDVVAERLGIGNLYTAAGILYYAISSTRAQ